MRLGDFLKVRVESRVYQMYLSSSSFSRIITTLLRLRRWRSCLWFRMCVMIRSSRRSIRWWNTATTSSIIVIHISTWRRVVGWWHVFVTVIIAIGLISISTCGQYVGKCVHPRGTLYLMIGLPVHASSISFLICNTTFIRRYDVLLISHSRMSRRRRRGVISRSGMIHSPMFGLSRFFIRMF